MLSSRFECQNAVAPLLAKELARSVILERFGLLDKHEIAELVSVTDRFVTNARIFNSSFDDAANVMIEFFPVGDSPRVMTVKIPARGTAVLNDIVGTSFGMTSAIGGARVTSVGRNVANVRIIADRRSSGGGTYGLLVPGLHVLMDFGATPPLRSSERQGYPMEVHAEWRCGTRVAGSVAPESPALRHPSMCARSLVRRLRRTLRR